MDPHDITQLKRLTVIALFSDDQLVDRLALKGGNALSLAHKLTARASFDLDFSMEGQFDESELADLVKRIEFRLGQTFEAVGFVVFDVKLERKPESISPELRDFWGGYKLEFKLIARQRHDELKGDLAAIRREAIPTRPGGRSRFQVDISGHEYCAGKEPIEIDRFTVYVYTPTMVVCEKVRAICQQSSRYARFVMKHRSPRARDFFDIHETIRHFEIDLLTKECTKLLRNMFQAKRVPVDLLLAIEQDRDFHRRDWDAVKDTVAPSVRLRKFDFYFDYVVELCHGLAKLLPG